MAEIDAGRIATADMVNYNILVGENNMVKVENASDSMRGLELFPGLSFMFTSFCL